MLVLNKSKGMYQKSKKLIITSIMIVIVSILIAAYTNKYTDYNIPTISFNLEALNKTFLATFPLAKLGYSSNFKLTSSIQYTPKDRTKDAIYKKYIKDLSNYSKTGEDNYFKGDTRFAVFDGVGGYIHQGYDCSIISSKFSKYLGEYNNGESCHLYDALTYAYKQVLNDSDVKAGATTATVCQINEQTGHMDVINLGDSWLGVLRGDKIVFETLKQEYYFNAPYQLAKVPGSNKGSISNTPDDAVEYDFQLNKGDLVILSTDGMVDNWGNQKIEGWWSDKLSTNEDLDSLNRKFVDEVVACSKDHRFMSSFVREYNMLNNSSYVGGKEDDITVLVVKVE
ncbi:hypothetical protein ACO0R3_003991 [Hanseniaspora guilliermondii]